MSSRNQYLSAEQREQAGVIHATLQWMRARALASRQSGTTLTELAAISAQATERLEKAGLATDYAVIRNAADLREPRGDQEALVTLIAARMGNTRLIDNLLIEA
jgi:pantoate--beta-alanine ligase